MFQANTLGTGLGLLIHQVQTVNIAGNLGTDLWEYREGVAN